MVQKQNRATIQGLMTSYLYVFVEFSFHPG